MLHWVYIAIACAVGLLVVVELLKEKDWRQQIAMTLILVPFILRILHIK